MLSFLFGLGVGVVIAIVVGFLVWRNNKVKFQEAVLKLDEIAGKYDTKEELKAKLEELLAELKK